MNIENKYNLENKYKLIKLLGKGAFGEVYKAERLFDGKIIALKLLSLPTVKREKNIKMVEKEIEILKTLSKDGCNPFVICYYDSHYDKEDDLYVIEMEYVEGKELRKWLYDDFNRFLSFYGYLKYKKDFINNNIYKLSLLNLSNITTLKKVLNEKQIKLVLNDLAHFKLRKNQIREYYLLLIVKDITKGLKYIHDKGIFHNDIKMENIIIENESFIPKIIDFGISCEEISSELKYCITGAGTGNYLPPEFTSEPKFKRNDKTDMWALGVVMYFMVRKKFPYKMDANRNKKEFLYKIKNTQHEKIDTSNQLLNFVSNGLLNKNPEMRWSSEQVIDFLSDNNLQKFKKQINKR